MPRPNSWALLLALIVAATATAQPRSSDEPLLSKLSLGRSDAPVEVTADRLDFAYEERRLTYEGTVVVKQADISLRADKLVVQLGHGDEVGLRRVVAEGNVDLTQGNRRATGKRAVFDNEKQTVVLSGSAVLQDGPNQVTGERIVIDLASETSVVQGGEGRVRALLYPSTPARAESGASAPVPTMKGDDG